MFEVGTVVRSIAGWSNVRCDHGSGREFDLKPGMLAVVIRVGTHYPDAPTVTLRDFEGRDHTWVKALSFWEAATDA